MFIWKSAEERAKYGPHDWTPVRLGHSNTICAHCCATPKEIEYTGDLNHCEKNPPLGGAEMDARGILRELWNLSCCSPDNCTATGKLYNEGAPADFNCDGCMARPLKLLEEWRAAAVKAGV